MARPPQRNPPPSRADREWMELQTKAGQRQDEMEKVMARLYGGSVGCPSSLGLA